MNVSVIAQEAISVLSEVIERAKIGAGQLLVVGCSTSVVGGMAIGKAGSEDVAAILYEAFTSILEHSDIDVAWQCCEHLNRSLVVCRRVEKARSYEAVSVVPVRGAGGAMAAHAYRAMGEPVVVVEAVRADAGLDIGGTLIGMHIPPVVVPLHLAQSRIGEASVIAAFRRPKLIGGARAVYALS